MKYEIIPSKDEYDASFIKEIDEQQFYNIIKFINNIDVDDFDIYELLYQSKYNEFPSSSEREKLNNKLELLKSSSILETNQNKSGYEWIHIKRDEIENIAFRYYFGINPKNLYKLVEKLTIKFVDEKIPVEFKYQKETKKGASDRIILYTDFKNKKNVERVINDVYNENKELFDGSERALPWIYESNTPNVYIAPESLDHEKSFGEKISQSFLESKYIFHYFCQEDRVSNLEQLEFLKKIVLSTMLRNGVLLEKSGKRIRTYENGIKIFYYKEKNELDTVIDEKNGNYYEVKYDSSIDGKKAFLRNFYSVKNIEKLEGMTYRVLTREERNREIFNALYPHLANGHTK